MSGSRFNLDILYVVPILVSLIVLNYSLYLEYLRHVLSYNVYCHFNWAYQLRCTSWCVWNGLMYGRLTKFLNGRSPFFGGDVIPVGYGTSPLHYIWPWKENTFPALKNRISFTYDAYSPDGTPHHFNLATVHCKGKYVCGTVKDYNTQTAQ